MGNRNNWAGTMLSVFKGIGVWIVLILLNTRGGESGLNAIKLVLDVVLAVMIVNRNTYERYAALGIGAVSILIAALDTDPWLEILLLALSVAAATAVVHYLPGLTVDSGSFRNEGQESGFPTDLTGYWQEKNRLNPWFERYYYSRDEGLNIRRGVLRRTFINIPTNNVRMRIDQSLLQRIFGLCNVSFFNTFTGKVYGDEILHNIRMRSAVMLQSMI